MAAEYLGLLLRELVAAYPSWKATSTTLAVYAHDLEEIEPAILEASLLEARRVSDFPPPVARILSIAARKKAERDAALGAVNGQIRGIKREILAGVVEILSDPTKTRPSVTDPGVLIPQYSAAAILQARSVLEMLNAGLDEARDLLAKPQIVVDSSVVQAASVLARARARLGLAPGAKR